MKYLSSQETLEQLCNEHPDRPVLYGLGKTLGGAALIGAGVWATGETYEWMFDLPYYLEGVKEHLIQYGARAAIGVLDAGLLLAGGVFGYDGVTSMAKPLGDYDVEKHVWYRNGGLTRRPSEADKQFGTFVLPAESIEQIHEGSDCFALLNGIEVEDTDYDSHWDHVSKTTKHEVTVLGRYRGEPIRLCAESIDEQFIEGLRDTQGTSIYALCDVEGGAISDVRMFGPARKAAAPKKVRW